MSGIRIIPFGMAPKISNLVVDGDLNLGDNKLFTNMIEESIEGRGVSVDGRLTCEGVTSLSHVVTPSGVTVLYTNTTSYTVATGPNTVEEDLFSITVPPGYAAGGVSVTVEPTITVKSTGDSGFQASFYVYIYVNGAIKCTLSHTGWLDDSTGGSSTATKTGTLLGMSPGDVILVRGYPTTQGRPFSAKGVLSKFEIKGNSGGFVESGTPPKW